MQSALEWGVRAAVDVTAYYDQGVLAVGTVLLLAPDRCMAVTSETCTDALRLLGVWVLGVSVAVREARHSRRIPPYLLPLYALLSLAVPMRQALLREERLTWQASCLILMHLSALLLQTVGLKGNPQLE